MIRTTFVLLLFTLWGSIKAQEHPNIIFLLHNDIGYGELSCHGNPIIKTTNIDKLHSRGIRLTNFHVAPTRSASRVQLMRGKHEFKSGVTHTLYPCCKKNESIL